MQFVARRAFKWEGVRYQPGETLEIWEEHPRLGMMLQGRYVSYDNSQDVPHGPGVDVPQPMAKPRTARAERLARA